MRRMGAGSWDDGTGQGLGSGSREQRNCTPEDKYKGMYRKRNFAPSCRYLFHDFASSHSLFLTQSSFSSSSTSSLTTVTNIF